MKEEATYGNEPQCDLLDELLSRFPAPHEEMRTAANDFVVRMPWGYCGNEIWNQSRAAEVGVLMAERLAALAAIAGGDDSAADLDRYGKRPKSDIGFNLPGVDGKRYTLASFAPSKVLVIVFTANHCPTAQAYEQRIAQLDADFRDRGVQLVLVSPNDPLALRLDEQGYTDLGDTLEEMKLRAQDRGWKFPYLYDGETEAMSRQYGPVATPHVFVFDAARRLRFAGRVDDNENPAKATTADARDAILAVLAGKPVPVETTKVFGCSVKWADKRGSVKEGFDKWAQEPVAFGLSIVKPCFSIVAITFRTKP